MDYLENLELIKRLGCQISKPRSYCYSEELIAEYLRQYRQIEYKPLHICNESNERLKASLFIRGQASDICIVFMHGLGSMRLEGLNLLKQMPEGYSLCVFDFSGSGKSQGTSVSYGMKEKHDIQSVLNILRLRYSKFVLWGRSMGAVSALLYAITYNNPSDIIMLVLDSPFSSFQIITKELVARKGNVPSFMANVLLDLIKANFKKSSNNPFQIDCSDCSNCLIPSLFIYSNNDDVVTSDHTHRILANYKAKYDKIMIPENHNAPRSRQTLQKIFNAINTNTSGSNIGLRRNKLFSSAKDLGNIKKGRGINIISREKSLKKINIKTHEKKTTASRMLGMSEQYYVKSVELSRVPPNCRSPIKKSLGVFCSSLENDITYTLTDKITKKMLSNQRYL